MYMGAAVIWIVFFIKHRQDILMLQVKFYTNSSHYHIRYSLVLLFVFAFLRHVYYMLINYLRIFLDIDVSFFGNLRFIILLNYILSIFVASLVIISTLFRKTISRVLVLIVCMGFGTTK